MQIQVKQSPLTVRGASVKAVGRRAACSDGEARPEYRSGSIAIGSTRAESRWRIHYKRMRRQIKIKTTKAKYLLLSCWQSARIHLMPFQGCKEQFAGGNVVAARPENHRWHVEVSQHRKGLGGLVIARTVHC